MRRALPSPGRFALLRRIALAAAALLSACAGGETTTPKPQPSGRMTFVVTTSLAVPAPVDSYSGARVRVIAADGAAAGTAILSQVMPVGYPWEAPTVAPVPLDLAGVTATRVVVEVELLDWKDSTTVHWAARSDTIALRDGPIALPLRFGRGPIANLAVERVTVAPAAGGAEPLVMAIGEEVPLAIEAPGAVQRYAFATDPRVAGVVAGSVLRAWAPGGTQVVVAAGLRADTLQVTVQPPPASLVVEPAMVELASFGDTVQFTVRARDASGAEVRAGPVWWRSAGGAVFTPVSASGQFIARANGEFAAEAVLIADTSVRATGRILVRQRLASITLSPSGGTLRGVYELHPISARPRDARGYFLDAWPAAPQWSVASATGMQLQPVSPEMQYLVSDGRMGDVTVTVDAGGVRGVASYVVAPLVKSVVVTGAGILRPGGSAQFSATVRDELDREVPAAVAWSSSDPSVATVSASGLVTALREGRVAIAAAEPSGVRGEMAVEVAPPVASMRATTVETPISWPKRYNEVFLAVRVFDRDGNPVPGAPVRWVSAVGHVKDDTPRTTNATGEAMAYWTGPATGVYDVRAEVEGTPVGYTFQVFIADAAPGMIELLQSPPDTVTSGVTWPRQPVARVLDVDGKPMKPAGIPVRAIVYDWVGTLEGTTTVPIDADGIARFTGLSLTAPVGRVRLGFETAGYYAVRIHDVVVR